MSARQLVSFCLVLFPILCAYLVVRTLENRKLAAKWLQNDAVFFFFWPVAVPAALAIFLGVLGRGPGIVTSMANPVGGAVTVGYLLVLALVVHLNFTDANGLRRILPPYYYRDARTLAALHERLLASAAGLDRRREANRKDALRHLIETYTSQSGTFRSTLHFLKESTAVGKIQFLMSIFADGLSLVFLWYLSLIALSGSQLPDQDWTGLVWVVLLLFLWAPTRLYTEWYRHFRTLEWVRHSLKFWFSLLILILAALFLAAVHTRNNRVAVALSTIAALVSLANVLRPKLIETILEFFSTALTFQAHLLLLGTGFIAAWTLPAIVTPMRQVEIRVAVRPASIQAPLLLSNPHAPGRYRATPNRDGIAVFKGVDATWLAAEVTLAGADSSLLLTPAHFRLARENAVQAARRREWKQQAVRIVILRSGDLAYTRDIRDGFKSALDPLLKAASLHADIVDFVGPSDPSSEKVEKEWADRLDAINDRKPWDYYVGVGTQAAMHLLQKATAEKFATPLIFLGVTEPVSAGLVDTLTDRQEREPVGGVAYIGAIEGILAKISHMFQSRRLVYIYRDYPQDVAMAQRLSQTALFRNKTLTIRQVSAEPTLADMPDAKTVYFSWYTFEKMLEEHRGLELLRKRLVVATTAANVRDGLAPVGVSADDVEIGRTGAELLSSVALVEGVALGSTDVRAPKVRYWINCAQMQAHGIQLAPEVIAGAQSAYACEASPSAAASSQAVK